MNKYKDFDNYLKEYPRKSVMIVKKESFRIPFLSVVPESSDAGS